MSRNQWIVILVLSMSVVCVCIGGPVIVVSTWPPAQLTAPSQVIWILDAPPGRGHGLWSQGALFDEYGGVLIGEIMSGTRMTPAGQGCYHATWDTGDPEIHPGGPYIYCHVRVLDGDLAGAEGWVKQDFIRK